jgi:hypothetical protein
MHMGGTMKAKYILSQIAWAYVSLMTILAGISWTLSDTGGGIIAMLALVVGGISIGVQITGIVLRDGYPNVY